MPKISFRQLELKGKTAYQVSIHQKKITHENLSPEKCLEALMHYVPQYKQILFSTETENYQVLQSKKGAFTILKKAQNRLKQTTHNRVKNYFLEEGQPYPFLVELGVMNASGKILPGKRDKFRQINRFLELIDDVAPHLPKEVKVVDFGCGKAYLTFALYHYLSERGFAAQIIGLDLKEDVVAFCRQTASKLGFSRLDFRLGDIRSHAAETVDLVVCLHACDTATDAALEKAVEWGAKVIMAVPCCQHEWLKQIECPPLRPLLKHGVLKERFSALATDAARALKLEILGYKTQVFEFIDMEHTPKNLMIRAVKQKGGKDQNKLKEEYDSFIHFLGLEKE